MATEIADLLTQARVHLSEFSPRAWSDETLLVYANGGFKDMWRRIVDLYKHHFVTINDACGIVANTSVIAFLPDDCYKVVSIEPRTLGEQNPNRGLIFKPKDWNDPAFVQARARGVISPTNAIIYYDIFTQGAPVSAPMIRIAPQVSSDVPLTLVYNHTLPKFDETDYNPIPGESDTAIVNWIVAYARAIEREDRAPDPEWLALYATEKTNTVAGLTPRQIQESSVALGMFEDEASES
jgi:hypothetical protein